MPATRTRQTARTAARQVVLTADGVGLLEERLADITDRRLPEVRPLLTERERDERDVAAFEALLAEEARLQALLAEAQVLQPVTPVQGVGIGVRARVTLADGSTAWVRPVHPAEAYLDDERISISSPLGSALLGAAPGDVVTVEAPIGSWQCRVESVEGMRKRRAPRPVTGRK
jgi:transcription elongation factor GreA